MEQSIVSIAARSLAMNKAVGQEKVSLSVTLFDEEPMKVGERRTWY